MDVDPQLAGRPVGDLRRVPSEGRSASVDGASDFASVDPAAPTVPAFVSGELKGVAVGARLAVAINGRVETTPRAYRDGGPTVFSTLVRPAALREGANRVEVFEWLGGDTVRELGRVQPPEYRLLTGASGDALVHGGTRTPVAPDGAQGFMDDARIEGDKLLLRGWAAKPGLDGRADTVVAVAGDRAIGASRPGLAREDLADTTSRKLRNAGYLFTLPLEQIRAAGGPVRVFAIAGDRAGELKPVGNVAAVLGSLPGG
jgi:hypothetical protein